MNIDTVRTHAAAAAVTRPLGGALVLFMMMKPPDMNLLGEIGK
jgi:hypothetical protein